MISRKKTICVNVGGILIGGGNAVVIQSMTNTQTADIDATVQQIIQLIRAGSELVRLTVNDDSAAIAIPLIVSELHKKNIFVPLVGDFHYNGHILLQKYPEMAKALAKYRINPGNVGRGEKKDENFKKIIECAIKYNKPVRIGVNGGSLDDDLLQYHMDMNSKNPHPKNAKEVFVDAMVESALLSCEKAQSFGLPKDKIILSVKMSDIQDMIFAYRMLSEKTDVSLHLGLTEAGGNAKGVVSSSIALGLLLQDGIGDTIRVSLTPEPGAKRSLEVDICKYILQTMGIRKFQPLITSCPGCGRTSSDKFQKLAKNINEAIQQNYHLWQTKYPRFTQTNIAVMGCIVNGPGEAKNADIGIFLPGVGEQVKIPVYIKGQLYKHLEGEDIFEQFMMILESYLAGVL